MSHWLVWFILLYKFILQKWENKIKNFSLFFKVKQSQPSYKVYKILKVKLKLYDVECLNSRKTKWSILNLINILYHIARPSDKKPQQATILESIALFILGQGVYLV